MAFLQQVSNGRLPPNAARQLELWAGRYDQVQLEETILLTVKSNQALRELSELPETRSLIARVLSPTSALVRKKDYARLKKELRALGFLPRRGPPQRYHRTRLTKPASTCIILAAGLAPFPN